MKERGVNYTLILMLGALFCIIPTLSEFLLGWVMPERSIWGLVILYLVVVYQIVTWGHRELTDVEKIDLILRRNNLCVRDGDKVIYPQCIEIIRGKING